MTLISLNQIVILLAAVLVPQTGSIQFNAQHGGFGGGRHGGFHGGRFGPGFGAFGPSLMGMPPPIMALPPPLPPPPPPLSMGAPMQPDGMGDIGSAGSLNQGFGMGNNQGFGMGNNQGFGMGNNQGFSSGNNQGFSSGNSQGFMGNNQGQPIVTVERRYVQQSPSTSPTGQVFAQANANTNLGINSVAPNMPITSQLLASGPAVFDQAPLQAEANAHASLNGDNQMPENLSLNMAAPSNGASFAVSGPHMPSSRMIPGNQANAEAFARSAFRPLAPPPNMDARMMNVPNPFTLTPQQANSQANAALISSIGGSQMSQMDMSPSVMNSYRQPMIGNGAVGSAQARAQLNGASPGTDGLQIDQDNGSSVQPPPPMESSPTPMPPQDIGSAPPSDSSAPPPINMEPPTIAPSSRSSLTVKGSTRKTESFSMQKSGSKTSESQYELMGSWDSSDISKRGGRFENGRLVFTPLQISVDLPMEQQNLLSPSSIGFQGKAGFFTRSSAQGICGYAPQSQNAVSLPLKYMPNACNRCIAIKSGNRYIKAVVADACVDCGDNPKIIKLATDMCSKLGVTPNVQLQVDWDFVPC